MATARPEFQQWVIPQEGLDERSFISVYAAEIELGSYRFADLFKDIRPYIENDQDLPGIARALSFLPLLFEQLISQETPFLASDHQFILKWLCQRISNATNDPAFRAGTDEVIDAIRAISKSGSFTELNAVEVIESVFALEARLTYKDLKTKTRANVLVLLQGLFSRYKVQFSKKPSVNSFVTGLTELTQFEKSPKCLGVLFPLFTNISKAWASDLETQKFAEKLFGAFYRYFPIDVQRTYSQDPTVPTLEELAQALEECITASPIYADFAFEQLLGNLDITQGDDSKKKTLGMLLSCVSTYPIATIQAWQIKIWDALKYEIWQGQNEEIVQASLKILHQVCKGLGIEEADVDDQQTSITRYLKHIGAECDAKTQDSMQWLVPNGRILYALGTSGPPALVQITRSYIPKMHLHWQDLGLAKEKAYLLISLTEIIRAHTEVYGQVETVEQDKLRAFSALQACHTQIDYMYDEGLYMSSEQSIGSNSGNVVPELYLNTTKYEDLLVKTAVEGLALLVDIPRFYDIADQDNAVKSIITVLVSTIHEGTRVQCVSVLQRIAARQPAVYHAILNELFSHIPDSIMDEFNEADGYKTIKSTISFLETMVDIGCSEVCKQAPVVIDGSASSYWHTNFNALVHRLLLTLKTLFLRGGQYDFAHILLLTISRALDRFENSLAVARATPNTIEPKAREQFKGPYTDLVMALFKLLNPQQRRHERWQHTTEIEWYTYIGGFPEASTKQIDRMVQSIGQITLQALRSKSTNDENNFLLRWNDDTENNDCSALSSLFAEGKGGCDMLRMDDWQPDVRRGPSEKCLANVLSMYMIAGVRPYHRANLRIVLYDVVKHMMKGYIGFDIEAAAEFREGNASMSPLSRRSMLWYIQLLVNKFGVASEEGEDGKTPLDVLKLYIEEARSVTADVIMPANRHIRVIQVLAHFTAAALAAFDSKTMQEGFRLLTQCLEDPAPYGLITARLFRVMLEPSKILTRENFCNVRSVGRSWVLKNIVPSLRFKWRVTEDREIKVNFLIALSTLLEYLDPKDYITDQGEALLPAILEGTNIQDDAPAKLIYLVAIDEYISIDREAVEQHLHTVIRGLKNRLLNTLDDPSDSPVNCRMAAVDVLKTLMRSYGKDRLMRFRDDIESEINMACEDSSPEVRRKGHEAGSLWGVWLSTEN